MSRPARATHGDTGYARRHKCPCVPCANARARYQKRLEMDHARGIKRRQDAAPIRAHVQQLLDAGATYATISNATEKKVVTAQIRRLIEGGTRGPVTYLFKPTVEALMAVTPEQCVGKAFRPAIGVQRRIQALHALGFTAMDLGNELGITDTEVYQYMKRTRVTDRVHTEVKEVYERLAVQRGASERLRWKAHRMGWPPPMAWDDEAIDDPEAKPNYRAVLCVVTGCSSYATRRTLCLTHYKAMVERGGLKSAMRFRVVVMQLKSHHVASKDKQSLLYELSDLKARGYTPTEAAMELGRGAEYIKKMWKEAS